VAWTIALRAAAPGFDMDPIAAYQEAITILRDLQEWFNLWMVVESLGTWWSRTGKLEQAATAFGFLDNTGPGHHTIAQRRAKAARLVDAHPDAPRWRADGAAMSRDQVISYCLEQLGEISN
jgi:hypothetical protein